MSACSRSMSSSRAYVSSLLKSRSGTGRVVLKDVLLPSSVRQGTFAEMNALASSMLALDAAGPILNVVDDDGDVREDVTSEVIDAEAERLNEARINEALFAINTASDAYVFATLFDKAPSTSASAPVAEVYVFPRMLRYLRNALTVLYYAQRVRLTETIRLARQLTSETPLKAEKDKIEQQVARSYRPGFGVAVLYWWPTALKAVNVLDESAGVVQYINIQNVQFVHRLPRWTSAREFIENAAPHELLRTFFLYSNVAPVFDVFIFDRLLSYLGNATTLFAYALPRQSTGRRVHDEAAQLALGRGAADAFDVRASRRVYKEIARDIFGNNLGHVLLYTVTNDGTRWVQHFGNIERTLSRHYPFGDGETFIFSDTRRAVKEVHQNDITGVEADFLSGSGDNSAFSVGGTIISVYVELRAVYEQLRTRQVDVSQWQFPDVAL